MPQPTLLPTHNHPQERLSIDSQDLHELYAAKLQSEQISLPARVSNSMSSLFNRLPYSSSLRYPRRGDYEPLDSTSTPLTTPLPPTRRCIRRLRRIPYYLAIFCAIIAALAALTFTFFPSYTHPPAHYTALREQVRNAPSPQSGRGNPHNEKVFIAASLYDPTGELAGGHWGASILELIDLLGEENVFLSVYENDSGDAGETALSGLDDRVACNKSLVFEHLDLDELPTIKIPDGAHRVKRISYLAETRNRALRPLENSSITYDKLLYLNDVAFDPLDALQLLFSTNVNEHSGKAEYRAACAVDFINPFKFYDTYATRDLEGFSMGVPFYPWFTDSGNGVSRRSVLAGSDAVPVRSCWGGMVAFDARFFQGRSASEAETKAGTETKTKMNPVAKPPLDLTTTTTTTPARFRALNDTNLFWDASECCLIHADIQRPYHVDDNNNNNNPHSTGIYMNPFVRVAYDPRTLSWLGTTRRFEKLYFAIHNIVNHLVGLPWFNARRDEIPGKTYGDTVFVVPAGNGDEGAGSFVDVQRVGRHDGFCGRPGLQVVQPREEGGKGWLTVPMPVAEL
ncbi:cryptococcal mannosyltransferase 1-domain-containing protein [Aspergillus heterothallicus]